MSEALNIREGEVFFSEESGIYTACIDTDGHGAFIEIHRKSKVEAERARDTIIAALAPAEPGEGAKLAAQFPLTGKAYPGAPDDKPDPTAAMVGSMVGDSYAAAERLNILLSKLCPRTEEWQQWEIDIGKIMGTLLSWNIRWEDIGAAPQRASQDHIGDANKMIGGSMVEPVVFDCHGRNAPAYGCNKPGDMSGAYYPESAIQNLQSQIATLTQQLDEARELEKLAAVVKSVETDINKRWEKGIPHHPRAAAWAKLIADADMKYGGDYFCLKFGGDGDNGEHLLYLLSVAFELEDEAARLQEDK